MPNFNLAHLLLLSITTGFLLKDRLDINEFNSKPLVSIAALKSDSNKVVEKICFDLNHDGKADTIELANPPVEGNPGLFSKITINIQGSKLVEFYANDVWDVIDKPFAKSNLVKSDKVYIKADGKRVYLVLFGYQYGSGRDEFTVIRIKDNIAKIIYNLEMNEPIGFQYYGNPKTLKFIGRTNHCEYLNSSKNGNYQTSTYSPFYVYNLTDIMSIDTMLTKQYNLKNYVWAGLNYNEKLQVLEPQKPGLKYKLVGKAR
ncbi:MAG: hypothetical protein ACOVMN_00635 [Flexibacteraceae bacterium]